MSNKTVKKICRKKSQEELCKNPEQRKTVREMATRFREEEFKKVLKKCYKDVQKYGPEAIMESISWISDKTWTSNKDENDFNLEVFVEQETEQYVDKKHNHIDTLKRNAKFFIEASEAIDDYDPDTLKQMKIAFKNKDYDEVSMLAYLHDGPKRGMARFTEQINKGIPSSDPQKKVFDLLTDLLTEVAEDVASDDNAVNYLVKALRELDGPLTYDNRANAKFEIQEALKLLDV